MIVRQPVDRSAPIVFPLGKLSGQQILCHAPFPAISKSDREARNLVMPGLVPGIHVFPSVER
jgi:hypothetical protein